MIINLSIYQVSREQDRRTLSRDMSGEDSSKPIIITGFGPIIPSARDSKSNAAIQEPVINVSGDASTNLSATIVKQLFDSEQGLFYYSFEEIPIEIGPDYKPVTTSYNYVNSPLFDHWLESSDARLYVHLGTTLSNDTIYFEQRAYNFPVDRDTGKPGWVADYLGHFNYGKACVPDSTDPYLTTSFNIPELIEKIKNVTGNISPLCFQESCNAGNFLCNFLYYKSLYYAKTERGNANVIFIHIPEELPQGVAEDDMVFVIKQTVCCLLDMQAQGKNQKRGQMRKQQWQPLIGKQARRSARRRRKRKWRLRQRKNTHK